MFLKVEYTVQIIYNLFSINIFNAISNQLTNFHLNCVRGFIHDKLTWTLKFNTHPARSKPFTYNGFHCCGDTGRRWEHTVISSTCSYAPNSNSYFMLHAYSL